MAKCRIWPVETAQCYSYEFVETEKLYRIWPVETAQCYSYEFSKQKNIETLRIQFYDKSVGFGLSKQPNAIPMSLSKQKNCM